MQPILCGYCNPIQPSTWKTSALLGRPPHFSPSSSFQEAAKIQQNHARPGPWSYWLICSLYPKTFKTFASCLCILFQISPWQAEHSQLLHSFLTTSSLNTACCGFSIFRLKLGTVKRAQNTKERRAVQPKSSFQRVASPSPFLSGPPLPREAQE